MSAGEEKMKRTMYSYGVLDYWVAKGIWQWELGWNEKICEKIQPADGSANWRFDDSVPRKVLPTTAALLETGDAIQITV
jgi:hypothetical protein